jgi:hypothetical protein
MRGFRLRAFLLAGALVAAFLFSGCIAEWDDDDDDEDDQECEDWAYWNNESAEDCPYDDDDDDDEDDFMLGIPALFQVASIVAVLGTVAVGLNNRSTED